MIPGKYDITIYRGGTWSIALGAEDENGNPTDFSVYDEVRMQIRPPWVKGIPAKPPLLELSLVDGRITLISANTHIELTVSAQDTAALVFDEGQYELELVKHVDLAAEPPILVEVVDKLIYGSVVVTGEVTV